jgi:hypothetical protein
MYLLQSGREYVEDCCAGLGILAAQDAQQRGALCLIGALVDHDCGFALAFMNGARPSEYSYELEAIELGRAVMTLRTRRRPGNVRASAIH